MNKTLATLSALMVFLTGALATTPDISQEVVDVIDGDTIVMANHQRVRLRGLDAPELGRCGSQEAKDYLTKLVKNKKVILGEPIADHWSRVVALVYLDNKLINLDMIAQGYGHYESGPSSMLTQFQTASKNARDHQLGIYGPQCYQKQNPDHPRCQIKGNLDVDRGTKIYHLPECYEYDRVVVETSSGEQWFCTELEAKKAGFTKSINCP